MLPVLSSELIKLINFVLVDAKTYFSSIFS